MNPLIKKLGIKPPAVLHLLQVPQELFTLFTGIEGLEVQQGMPEVPGLHTIMVFCTQQAEVDAYASRAHALLQGDAMLWMAYPKGSSKQYKCNFNRDTGWAMLGQLGYEPVRQVAIDDDWSALRFRKVEYIKSMTRSFAMTDEGKRMAGKA